MNTPTPELRASLQFSWLGLFLVVLLVLGAQQPPQPLPADAPAAAFSAARANDVLKRILGDQLPHPLGSTENAAVRGRVIAEFEHLGVAVDTRPRFVCSDYDICGTPNNLLARLAGSTNDAPALLLTAHYDSVAAGPGAADDAAGVAALIEIARALKAETGPHRELLFLIADGEEAGLLGAEAFVQEPEFARVGAVLNLEARGTGGRSNLFETQVGNAALIGAIRWVLPYPALDSVAFEVYTRMPNNTDFTVYKRERAAGLNFAFIGGGERYHTPNDDLAHLDLRALQQQGSNVLAAARALMAPEVEFKASSNRVYFDVLGRVVATWPAQWNAWLCAFGVLLALLGMLRSARRAEAAVWRLWLALLALLFAGGTAAGLTAAAVSIWRAVGAVPLNWTANAFWLQSAAAAIGLASALGIAIPAARMVSANALLQAWLLLFGLIALAATQVVPGAAHLGLVPLIAGSAGLCLWPALPWRAAFFGSAGAALVLLPSATQLYDGLGPRALPVIALLIALTSFPMGASLSLATRTSTAWLRLCALLLAVVLVGLATWLPPFDVHSRPQINLNLVSGPDGSQLQFEGRESFWATSLAGALPAAPTLVPARPWDSTPTLAIPMASSRGMESPRITIEAGSANERWITLEWPPSDSLDQAGIVIPSTIDNSAISVNDTRFAPPVRRLRAASSDWRSIRIWRVPGIPYRIRILWPSATPLTGFVFRRESRLPPVVAPIILARDSVAVPVHAGDFWLHWAPLEFPAEPGH